MTRSPDHLAAAALARGIIARLDTAIEQATVADTPWVVEQARRYRAKYAGWLNSDYDLGTMLGMFGPNGWQPGAQDVCDSAAFFAGEHRETAEIIRNETQADPAPALVSNFARARRAA